MRAALDFARPAYRDPRWVEAVEVAAVTTRDRLHFQLVAEFATNLDVAHTRVVVHAGDAASPVDLDFSDVQFNLPIGTSRLSGVSLASGVVMRTSVPHKEYELEYLSACGRVEARMEMTAVTAPVTGDVTRQESGDVRGSADVEPDDDARPGRIDQLVSVRGDLRVDDSFYTMDCLANRAHRWGSVPDVLPPPSESTRSTSENTFPFWSMRSRNAPAGSPCAMRTSSVRGSFGGSPPRRSSTKGTRSRRIPRPAVRADGRDR